jgi:transmembrane sensor
MTSSLEDRFEIAAAYFARLDSGSVSQKEREDFASWCASAPENRSAWEAVSRTWSDAHLSRDDSRIEDMIAAATTRYPMVDQPRIQRRWIPIALAASLVAAITVSTTLFLSRPQTGVPSAVAVKDPALQESTQIASGRGKRRTVGLPDGSRVTLDSDTVIHVAFADDKRAIRLEKGRAHFTVQKDKSRPFIVDAGRLSAVAVGTAFDVRRDDIGEEVVTTEGLVRVLTKISAKRGSYETMVPAGMKLLQDRMSVHFTNADIAADTAWQTGKIVFSSECLAKVAARVNRYGSKQIIVDRDAANIAISGVFELNNALGLAQALQDQGIVESVAMKDGIVLTRGPHGRRGTCVSS